MQVVFNRRWNTQCGSWCEMRECVRVIGMYAGVGVYICVCVYNYVLFYLCFYYVHEHSRYTITNISSCKNA